MPCYHPLKGYRSKYRNPSGKRSIVFNIRDAFKDMPVELPCGQCIGCRLERSRQWAIRCVHEASLYEDNCFLTLTYSDENLPENGSVRVEDFQKFMKRLRFEFPDQKIRFFHCGEYGEKYGRPHYHACIFNFDFKDKYHWSTASNGEKYYRSPTLEKLWPVGQSMIGNVTFESAAYVARYITKKITGPDAHQLYEDLGKKPEYVTMSRRPGIGKPWLDKFKSDVFPDDFVVLRGKILKVPQFYMKELDKQDAQLHRALKAKRRSEGEKHKDNNTWDRLKVRKFIHVEKSKKLKRSYENG